MSAFSRLEDNARGILLMIAAVFLFTVMDAMAKALSQRVDTVMALWARYAGQTTIVLLIVLPRIRTVAKTNYPWLQLLRSIFLLLATTCFFFGITFIGLAEATAIMDVNPVLVTLGAALILGERFGPRRGFAVVAALVGALIIIRPGTEVFSPYAVFPLLAAVMFTGYALTTRFVGRDEDAWTSLLYTALVGALILSAIVPVFWIPPDGPAIALMLGIGGIGAVGQLLLIRALMTAEASVVAPFTYAGLLFATVWGMLFFGEFPDTLTYVGAAVVVISGLYVLYRETRLARPAAPGAGR